MTVQNSEARLINPNLFAFLMQVTSFYINRSILVTFLTINNFSNGTRIMLGYRGETPILILVKYHQKTVSWMKKVIKTMKSLWNKKISQKNIKIELLKLNPKLS